MSKEKNKFKEMSLGDHLEELRIRIMLALIGLTAGLILCLFFGGYFMRLVASPYESAMNVQADNAIAAVMAEAEAKAEKTGEPLVEITAEEQAEIRLRYKPGLQAINPPEKFIVYLKTSLLFGLIV